MTYDTVDTLGVVDAVPLSQAALCLDCETAFRINPHGCPACGSSSVYLISKWLAEKSARPSVPTTDDPTTPHNGGPANG